MYSLWQHLFFCVEVICHDDQGQIYQDHISQQVAINGGISVSQTQLVVLGSVMISFEFVKVHN